jgi:hypothetical protein
VHTAFKKKNNFSKLSAVRDDPPPLTGGGS